MAMRQLISSADLEKRSIALADSLLQNFSQSMPSSIFLFAPFRSEPDLFSLFEALPEVAFSLPVLARTGEDMDFYRHEPGDALVANKWGILEPKITTESVASMPDETTTILVPSLAVDKSGYRLGYGAGYYDRYLVSCPNSRSVGVCFSEFVFEVLPHDYWDQRLHSICTEREFFQT
jgi:5-formyltetrahydrofolate cyclo-ligase